MADAVLLPEGVKATVTAYVTSPSAELCADVRQCCVDRVSPTWARTLMAKAIDEMNAQTGLGDARPMTLAEIAAYLAGAGE